MGFCGRRTHRLPLGDNLPCSNHPVCAEYAPDTPHESRPLHGSACLLIARTSCEQHNDFLDHALVVPTVGTATIAFFDTGHTRENAQ